MGCRIQYMGWVEDIPYKVMVFHIWVEGISYGLN